MRLLSTVSCVTPTRENMIEKGVTSVSYLDSPRLHFAGWFQADVSTINNDVRFYQNASFVAEYQQLEQNGSWNPEGTGVFRFLDCIVTGGFLNGRQVTTDADDPVISMTVQNAADRAPGKLVDLDPQQQMVSQIWGMQVRLVDSGTKTRFRGEYKPAAFTNLWQRQKEGVRRDQQLAACYQSVLDEVVWFDLSDSPLLKELQAATEAARLSIEFNLYGYGRDSSIPRYTMGRVAGTIGPYFKGEPKHFVQGRQMVAVAPNFTQPAGGINNLQGKLAQDQQSVTFDFGNTFPIQKADSGLMDIGKVLAGVLKTNPDSVPSKVTTDGVVLIGEVLYLPENWYRQSAGVQSFDLSSNAAARELIETCPLVLLTPLPDAGGYKVLLQESVGGLYVRADSNVFRIDPGETQSVDFYASRFGLPLKNVTIRIASTQGFMGGSGAGDTVTPAPHPTATIPTIGIPADYLRYLPSIVTDGGGHASLAITASDSGPGKPRGYISGQLYGIGYQLADKPAGYVSNPLNYVSILAFSTKRVPDIPTWYRDIQQLFTQYGNLYPIMGRYVVDLRDYHSVVSRIEVLDLAFSLPINDPNHMPVTRDLGASDRATILKWLRTKGHDGLPPLGIPSESPAVPQPTVSDELAASKAGDLLPGQGAGKTAVILQLERTGKIPTAKDQEPPK